MKIDISPQMKNLDLSRRCTFNWFWRYQIFYTWELVRKISRNIV